MQGNILFISFITLVLLSACSSSKPKVTTKEKMTSKEKVAYLNKMLKNLSLEEKKQVYTSVQNDVDIEINKGKKAYELGHYANALTSYELVNFYEGKYVIAKEEIDMLKSIIKEKSIMHYENSLALKDDEKKQIIELNQVMIYDPSYKDAAQRITKLKHKHTFFFNSLENQLDSALMESTRDIESIKKMGESAEQMRIYEYNHPTVLKIDKEREKYYEVQIKDAIKIFDDGDMNKARESFAVLQGAYKDDEKIELYLNKIDEQVHKKQNKKLNIQRYREKISYKKKRNLNLAKKALADKKYKVSMFYTNKVLKLDKNHQGAKNLIARTNYLSKKEVESLLKRGKSYYINKNLERAKECFTRILEIDENNQTSLVYYKKIKRQLDTIKSLQVDG